MYTRNTSATEAKIWGDWWRRWSWTSLEPCATGGLRCAQNLLSHWVLNVVIVIQSSMFQILRECNCEVMNKRLRLCDLECLNSHQMFYAWACMCVFLEQHDIIISGLVCGMISFSASYRRSTRRLMPSGYELFSKTLTIAFFFITHLLIYLIWIFWSWQQQSQQEIWVCHAAILAGEWVLQSDSAEQKISFKSISQPVCKSQWLQSFFMFACLVLRS